LQALRHQRHYELCAILAQGSPRSVSVGRSHQVPLWRRVEDLPDDIDLACVALPLKASHITLDLLRRGIPVLCEHPQHSEFLRRAFRIAQVRGAEFHLNAHFGDLAAPQSFIRKCEQTRRRDRLAFISVLSSDRALFAALDILRRALGPLEFCGRTAEPSGSFSLVRGSLATAPTVCLVQRSRGPHDAPLGDADSSYLVDMQICVVFSSGILTLSSVAGPVLWNANYFRNGWSGDRLWEMLSPNKPMHASALKRARIAANERAIAALARSIRTGKSPVQQSSQHLLDVSRSWEKIARLLRS
jgi:thiazolinyl imide reductase